MAFLYFVQRADGPPAPTIAFVVGSPDTIVVTPNALSPTIPVTSYVVTCSNGTSLSGVGPTFAFSGLTSGQSYTFTAVSVSDQGVSSVSSAVYEFVAEVTALAADADFSELYAPELASYTNKLWVSPTGNDTTGDGSFVSPFLTIAKAVNTAQASGTAIMLMPGTYSLVNNSTPGATEGELSDNNKAIGFFGRPTLTTIEHRSSSRDVHALACRNANTVVQGLILKLVPSATQTANYACSVLGGSGAIAVRGQIRYCVLTSTGNMSFCYGNSSTVSTVQFVNCSFVVPSGKTGLSNYNNFTNVSSTDCAYSAGIILTGTVLRQSQASFTTDYYTSASGGVYYGDHNWSHFAALSATPTDVTSWFDDGTCVVTFRGNTYATDYTVQDNSSTTWVAESSPFSITGLLESPQTVAVRANYAVGSSPFTIPINVASGMTHYRIRPTPSATYPNTWWDVAGIRLYSRSGTQLIPSGHIMTGNWTAGNIFADVRAYCSTPVNDSATAVYDVGVSVRSIVITMVNGARSPTSVQVHGSIDGGVTWQLLATSATYPSGTTSITFNL